MRNAPPVCPVRVMVSVISMCAEPRSWIWWLTFWMVKPGVWARTGFVCKVDIRQMVIRTDMANVAWVLFIVCPQFRFFYLARLFIYVLVTVGEAVSLWNFGCCFCFLLCVVVFG